MKQVNGTVKGILSIFISMLILAACSDAEKHTGAEISAPADSRLAHVPADTPYLYVSSNPLPTGLSDVLLQSVNEEVGLTRLRLEAETKDATGPVPVPTKVMLAVLAELDGKISRDGLDSLGIPVDGHSLVYGLGLLPVIRKEISDPAKVNALLRRVEQNTGLIAPRGQYLGQEYLRFVQDKLVTVVAVTDKELIIALLPAAMEQQLLATLIGKKEPQPSLADSDVFQRFLSQHRFKGHGDGYVDFVKITDILLGDAQGANAMVWQALEPHPASTSASCKQLTRHLAVNTPRWVMGFTQATDDAFTLHTLLETSPGVGANLQRLAVPAHPHGASYDPAMLSLGLSLALPAARDGIKQALRSLLAQGKDCDWVNEKQITMAMLSMDMLMNPLLSGIKGVEVRLNDLDLDLASLQPQGMDAQLLLAVDDPKGLIGMAGLFNPKLAQLKIPMDGTPVALDLQHLTPGAPPTYVAIKDKMILVATGARATQGLERLMSSPAAGNPPLFNISYDLEKIGQRARPLLEQAIIEMQAKDDAKLPQTQEALNSLNVASRIYKQISLSMRADAKGLIMDMDARLNSP